MPICVIPARGGSKRIPRKNIKNFSGKPMIYWSIKTAMKSKLFEKILVSTDDKEIAEFSESIGAYSPFLRPPEISGDYSSIHSVIKHAINWLNKNGIIQRDYCCLLATAPLIKSSDLEKSYNLLGNRPKDRYVVSACKFPSPIQRALTKNNENQLLKMKYPENFEKRSQDLETNYYDAGQFYWANEKTWLNNKNIFKDSKLFELPEWRVVDIDNVEDWQKAEIIKKVLDYMGEIKQ